MTSELSSPKNLNLSCNLSETALQSLNDGFCTCIIIMVAKVWTIYFRSLLVKVFFFSLPSVSWRNVGIGNGFGSF